MLFVQLIGYYFCFMLNMQYFLDGSSVYQILFSMTYVDKWFDDQHFNIPLGICSLISLINIVLRTVLLHMHF